MDASGDQEADGEDLCHGDVEGHLQDGCLAHQRGLDDGPRQGHEPPDVSGVEDLSDTEVCGLVGHSDVVVLGLDWDPAEVGGHGEVGDGAEGARGDGGVVDESVVWCLSEHQDAEDDGAEGHHTEERPVDSGTTGRDVEICAGWRVDLDGLIAASLVQINEGHVVFLLLCSGAGGARERKREREIFFFYYIEFI